MALTLTRATVTNEQGNGTTIPNTTTVNIPGTATCLWIAWTIDDQGTTSRTFDVQYNGSSLNNGTDVVARKTDATSGPSFAVYRVISPASGSAVTIQVTSSPAFNNRAYRVIVVYAEGGDTGDPDDAAVMTDTGSVTALSQACDSPVGDMMLSFGDGGRPHHGGHGAHGDVAATRTDGTGGSITNGVHRRPGRAEHRWQRLPVGLGRRVFSGRADFVQTSTWRRRVVRPLRHSRPGWCAALGGAQRGGRRESARVGLSRAGLCSSHHAFVNHVD